MPFSKNKIKLLSIASAGGLIFWISVQAKKTRDILNGAFDPYILHVVEPKTVDRDVYPVTIDAARWIKPPNSEEPYYVTKWKTVKFAYARRLLSLTKAENQVVRQKATQKLAGIQDLETWQYSLLANSSTARTAVALARMPEADLRLQIQPYVSPEQCKEEYLVHILKEYLVDLEEKTKHPCITNFLSNSFADIQDLSKLFENYYDHTDHIAKCVKSTSDMLPLCLETILHHSTIEHYAKDIVENNGLYLLLEVYFRYRHVYEINVALCTIISNVSVHPEVADELHNTGWIAVLAKWARDKDTRLSVTASRALANLDFDDPLKPRYERGIYSLHPTMRTDELTKVDVVFIHGLLGGVFYTWRQRNPQDSALSILETITGEPELWSLKRYYTSDPVMQDYLERCEEQEKIEWEMLGNDFDIISYDLPTRANKKDIDGAYSCSSYDKVYYDEPRTQCWPKDWLTSDCPNLRIVGVNYDTSLSKWAGTCPEESSKMTLDERTEDLLLKLRKAGIGNRPIVWVSHSMGGLLVKNMICKAKEKGGEFMNIVENSKGIVFYSTPHNGSKIASLNQPTSLVVLPSVEVQELREESPHLKLIHREFLKLLENIPMQIVSFVETKATVVTALKFNFLMVEPKSGNPGVGEIFEVPLDHLGICKPINRESFLYQKVLNLVRTVLEEEVLKERQKSIDNHAEHCSSQFC